MSENQQLRVDLAQQDALLPGVSRTFALTIPELPGTLRASVTNAYLLCRIADTIEDDPRLSHDLKAQYHQRFIGALAGADHPGMLSADLVASLAPETLPAERELTREIPSVVRVTAALPERCRGAIERCVRVMCFGMPRFQQKASRSGLPTLGDVERYCYYVAGVVGEMLTELFCDHSRHIARHRDVMHGLAISFGQGLQLTNILKDFWDDRRRGACWLSRDVFSAAGIDPDDIDNPHYRNRLAEAFERFTAIAHACLRDALSYVACIPRQEVGIRRFCLWAIGLAIMTLRKIHRNPDFCSADQVKVSRRTLGLVITACNAMSGSNRALRGALRLAGAGVPLARDYGPRLSSELLEPEFNDPWRAGSRLPGVSA